jgi:hypothetical protein
VLVALYPDHSADLSSTLAMSLARIADDVPKARGYAVGKIVAAAVLSRWFSTTAGKQDAARQIGGIMVGGHP